MNQTTRDPYTLDLNKNGQDLRARILEADAAEQNLAAWIRQAIREKLERDA